ncbi:tyrosine-type recombinase/integrase [Proteobacteria bacterium 005FR1]|nr:tyrosine-type recombinase/integrase [Proteobacteria bacterium 005FR1]
MPTAQHSKPLSFRALDTMKPGQTMSDTGENRGLRITCGNGGTKTFFYRYRSPHTDKLVQTPIGYFPTTSLAEARVRLQELKSIRREGRCPATELKEERNRKKAPQAGSAQRFTVTDLVELYLQEYIEDRKVNGKVMPGARKRKGQDETRRTLYGDAVRVLGKTPAAEVSRQNVVDLVMEIVGRGSNVQAGNVLRELTSAYEFAIGRGKFEGSFANPGVLAKSSLKKMRVRLTSQRGKRILSDQELIKLLAWLPGSVFTPTQKNILRMTLWTACRTGELCDLAWKDVDLEKGTLHIPGKNGTERYVQLPNQAVDFLRQLKLTTGVYPFASQKTGKPIQQKSLTEQAWHLRESGRMVDIAHWTPHDLRRTVRTGLARLRCPNEVAEAILGHSRSGIEGTYDLHTYEAEAKEWLQKWADNIDDLMTSALESS